MNTLNFYSPILLYFAVPTTTAVAAATTTITTSSTTKIKQTTGQNFMPSSCEYTDRIRNKKFTY